VREQGRVRFEKGRRAMLVGTFGFGGAPCIRLRQRDPEGR